MYERRTKSKRRRTVHGLARETGADRDAAALKKREQEGNKPTKEGEMEGKTLPSTLTFLCTQVVTLLAVQKLKGTSATMLLRDTLVTRRSTALLTLWAPFSGSISLR